ncbi:antibiotic biosynthesis monooxygenase [Pseudoflavonifractor sp. 524-17]|uniref:putative quinol monooxygenase n=1 Tax=Pseudoflavonifractor sp. 524-17 TaxID=2304577 RepID=UPI00137AEF8B|nr:antibiotic biosynthesis monooxygenase family protein [Pseudoflavonifractor sp. 524-17]NCE63281.1 antibiotic biosynthesis monooxygenase [Pseudoflavonifractor sp. 524-17]
MSQSVITLNVIYTLKPGMASAFLNALAEDGVLDRIRQEAGCLQYEMFAAADTPDRLLLAEQWDSQANMDAHVAGPHFKTMQSIEGLHVDGVEVRRFDPPKD